MIDIFLQFMVLERTMHIVISCHWARTFLLHHVWWLQIKKHYYNTQIFQVGGDIDFLKIKTGNKNVIWTVNIENIHIVNAFYIKDCLRNAFF